MPHASERFDKYLSNYEFHSNSIEFRIYSSGALEKFKNVQSFQLNQLVNGRFYFAQNRRELLLLKYDMWYRWLCEIENLFIEYSTEHKKYQFDQSDRDFVGSLMQKTHETYMQIIVDTHQDFFDARFASIWLELNETVHSYMGNALDKLVGAVYIDTFLSISDTLIKILQNTLIEIHELDSLFCKKNIKCDDCINERECPKKKRHDAEDEIPFLIIGNLTQECFAEIDVCLVAERLRIYKKYFEIDEVFLKNYTEFPFSPNVVNQILEQGVEINYKKSIVRD